jgi:4-amino-4-deoxy-L-arabinose transferase-like glycosyltransferase
MKTFCGSAFGIFTVSVLVVLAFWTALPDRYKVNESSDYRDFYEPIARNIVEGRGYTRPTGSAMAYAPGLPIILAGVFKLAWVTNIAEPVFLSSLILVCMGLTSVLIFIIARTLWGGLGGIASVLWMTYPFALWLTKQPGTVIPFMVFLYGGICLFLYCLLGKNDRLHFYFVAGILVGCAMLVRPIAIGVGIVMGALLLLLRQDMLLRVKALSVSALLLGNIVAILPWELWVYSQTNQIVMISSTGKGAMRSGLVFGVELRNFRQGINLPDDVATLMRNLWAREDEMSSFQGIAEVLIDEAQIRPFAVAKLAALKLVRSWYATDSNRFEALILLIQLPYLLVVFLGTWCAWKRNDRARQLTICVWMITLYFWGMTFMVVPLLRYMVPVMGLLFLLVPPLFLKTKRESHNNVVV